jgi:hypothetical protein
MRQHTHVQVGLTREQCHGCRSPHPPVYTGGGAMGGWSDHQQAKERGSGPAGASLRMGQYGHHQRDSSLIRDRGARRAASGLCTQQRLATLARARLAKTPRAAHVSCVFERKGKGGKFVCCPSPQNTLLHREFGRRHLKRALDRLGLSIGCPIRNQGAPPPHRLRRLRTATTDDRIGRTDLQASSIFFSYPTIHHVD